MRRNIRQNYLATALVFAFLLNVSGPLPLAQADDFRLPAPGMMVHLSPPFDPPLLKGIKVHPDNPFRFDFILDKGDYKGEGHLQQEAAKLIKYFLASLTIPEGDLWVNLSPYEKDRIIPQSFGLTEMGRDLLAEDYMLKQITASLIYPEDQVGRKFWKRVYEMAQEKYGTSDVPVNTFNKVWIVPQKAVVYENAKAGTAYIVESRLKVMLEQDYLSLEKHLGPSQNDKTSVIGSQIVREVVIPELTKEVNEGKNFARLRQVYNSLILATWYKTKIKDSILSEVYADKNKIAGVDNADTQERQKIYQRYLKAFKKGVYNYIKEEFDPGTQEAIPKKYFSGGVSFAMAAPTGATGFQNAALLTFAGPREAAEAILDSDRAMEVTADIRNAGTKRRTVADAAMSMPNDYLVKILLDESRDINVRRAAAEGLSSEINNAEVRGAFLKVLNEVDDTDMIIMILNSFSQIPNQGDMMMALSGIKSKDYNIADFLRWMRIWKLHGHLNTIWETAVNEAKPFEDYKDHPEDWETYLRGHQQWLSFLHGMTHRPYLRWLESPDLQVTIPWPQQEVKVDNEVIEAGELDVSNQRSEWQGRSVVVHDPQGRGARVYKILEDDEKNGKELNMHKEAALLNSLYPGADARISWIKITGAPSGKAPEFFKSREANLALVYHVQDARNFFSYPVNWQRSPKSGLIADLDRVVEKLADLADKGIGYKSLLGIYHNIQDNRQNLYSLDREPAGRIENFMEALAFSSNVRASGILADLNPEHAVEFKEGELTGKILAQIIRDQAFQLALIAAFEAHRNKLGPEDLKEVLEKLAGSFADRYGSRGVVWQEHLPVSLDTIAKEALYGMQYRQGEGQTDLGFRNGPISVPGLVAFAETISQAIVEQKMDAAMRISEVESKSIIAEIKQIVKFDLNWGLSRGKMTVTPQSLLYTFNETDAYYLAKLRKKFKNIQITVTSDRKTMTVTKRMPTVMRLSMAVAVPVGAGLLYAGITWMEADHYGADTLPDSVRELVNVIENPFNGGDLRMQAAIALVHKAQGRQKDMTELRLILRNEEKKIPEPERGLFDNVANHDRVQRSKEGEKASDKAMNAVTMNKGGIDLSPDKMPIQLQNSGAAIKLHMDPKQLAQLQNAPGFVPVIINIQPMRDLKSFLGLGPQEAVAAAG